ncbi:hypothetical protein HDU76_006216 [Blyttiomyces sp. JEL0837]|nr:hypothetical protein HDU76_006216 [Blyttiomyces sp. JEL0837]
MTIRPVRTLQLRVFLGSKYNPVVVVIKDAARAELGGDIIHPTTIPSVAIPVSGTTHSGLVSRKRAGISQHAFKSGVDIKPMFYIISIGPRFVTGLLRGLRKTSVLDRVMHFFSAAVLGLVLSFAAWLKWPALVVAFLLRCLAEFVNAEILAQIIMRNIDFFVIDGVSLYIEWLMGWPPPAGLKLNSELNNFLGQLFMWLLQLWNGIQFYTLLVNMFESFSQLISTSDVILGPLRRNLPFIIFLMGYTGVFGATMIISLFSDLVKVTTLHLNLFYTIAAKIYNWQVKVILSLFTLFRGKKFNVLRNRVDSVDFDLDQLLSGTILFTVLVFLFPTVAVYYVLFSCTRVGVLSLQSLLEIFLAVLNHFPLFAITLRIKDPHRLPAGVAVKMERDVRSDAFSGGSVVYFKMESVPIGMSAIFYQYLYLLNRVRSVYLSAQVTKSLIMGKKINPLPRLQYPTLPDRGMQKNTFIELWHLYTA